MMHDEYVPGGPSLLERMASDRGAVPRQFEIFCQYDERYIELFHRTYMHVMREDSALTRREKELILVGVDAATYYEYGCKFHMRAALEHGASAHDIAETLGVAGLAGGIHVASAAIGWFDEVLNEE